MRAVPERTEQTGSYLILILLATIWIAVLIAIGTHIDVGLDISDSAYYLLSHTESSDIYFQPTLFGVVWKLISPFDGIIADRYFNLSLVQISFLFLAISIVIYLDLRDPIRIGFLIFFALGSSLFYIVTWLPDPSYNSLNLCVVAISWAAFFMLGRDCERYSHRIGIWAFIIGAVLAAAILVKATSAGLLGVALLLGYFFVDYSNLSLKRLARLAAFAIAGAIAFFLLTSSIDFTPPRIYKTMSNGLMATMLLTNSPLSVFTPVKDYVTQVSAASADQIWILVAFALFFAAVLFSRIFLYFWLRVVMSVVVSTAFIAIMFNFYYESPRLPFVNLSFWSALTLVTIARISIPSETKPRLIGVIFIMVLSLFIYSYGTGNGWLRGFSFAASFAWIAVAVILASIPSQERLVTAAPVIALFVSGLVAATIESEKEPYRLGGPMSTMTSATKAGPQKETIFVSPQLASFYNELAPIRDDISRLPKRPILIDLSGRAPMAAYQIGARVPRTPWILSEYPGSVRVFDLIVGQIPRDDIKQAWILQSPEYQKGFPNDILTKFGVNFPADYVEIAKVPLPYIEATGHLYAPKATIDALKDAAASAAALEKQQ